MKDLEILVPADTSIEKIAQRLRDFKNYGLQHVEDIKIKLIFATALNNETDWLKEGWSENIEVDILKTPYKQVSQRIHYYYANYCDASTARFFCKIDEDSITDIKNLMNNLDKMFDYEREYHITGEIIHDIDPTEKEIFNSLGYGWWQNGCIPFQHEHEISITTNAAMKRILEHSDCKKFFNTRKELAIGVGDHGLAFCARIVKIYPQSVKFLTKDPQLGKFSLFGGNYNHIHYASRDKNACVIKWFELIDDSPEIYQEFKNKKYFFNKKNNDKKWIRLNENKTVEIINKKEKIGIWAVTKNKNLAIFLNRLEENYPLIEFENEKTISGNYELIDAN